jgi:hypothetical protein
MLTEVKGSGTKARRTFLCGILCGVIMAAALTFTVAIPANTTHWQVEIVKRGGGAWYIDTSGHLGWMWTVEPIPHTPREKRVIVPYSQSNVRRERL